VLLAQHQGEKKPSHVGDAVITPSDRWLASWSLSLRRCYQDSLRNSLLWVLFTWRKHRSCGLFLRIRSDSTVVLLFIIFAAVTSAPQLCNSNEIAVTRKLIIGLQKHLLHLCFSSDYSIHPRERLLLIIYGLCLDEDLRRSHAITIYPLLWKFYCARELLSE